MCGIRVKKPQNFQKKSETPEITFSATLIIGINDSSTIGHHSATGPKPLEVSPRVTLAPQKSVPNEAPHSLTRRSTLTISVHTYVGFNCRFHCCLATLGATTTTKQKLEESAFNPHWFQLLGHYRLVLFVAKN